MTAGKNAFLAQAARFGLVGIANTAVGAGTTFALLWAGLGPYAANASGYVAGTLFSFVANSRWTFGASPDRARFGRFVLVIAAAYLLNLLVLALCLRLGLGEALSQVPAMVCFTVANFLGHRYFTFAQPDPST